MRFRRSSRSFVDEGDGLDARRCVADLTMKSSGVRPRSGAPRLSVTRTSRGRAETVMVSSNCANADAAAMTKSHSRWRASHEADDTCGIQSALKGICPHATSFIFIVLARRRCKPRRRGVRRVVPRQTMRVDYFHTSTPRGTRSGPRPRGLGRSVAGQPDVSRRHVEPRQVSVEVIDRDRISVVFSRGFASVYGEWRRRARRRSGGHVSESLRFPGRRSRCRWC